MTIDRLGGGVLAALAVVTLFESRKLPMGTLQNPGPAYMPVVLACLLLGFAVVVLAQGGRSARVASVGWSEWRHAIAILVVCALMALGLERLGYRLTTFLALAALLGLVERRSLTVTLAFAAVFAGVSFYLFSTMLRVPLPRGPWGL